MKFTRPQPAVRDDRGEITDVLVDVQIDAVTIVTSVKEAVRGNHYHKETSQYTYVMSGRVELLTQMPGSAVQKAILEPGDMALTVPMERHAVRSLEDSVMVVFTRGPRRGEDYESDTYRLEEPLRLDEPPKPTS